MTSVLNHGPGNATIDCRSLGRFTPDPSNQRLFGATQDLSDFLCEGQDVRLSTAALLSARFPFVSPAGRLEAQCLPAAAESVDRTDPPASYVVDGGYFESSAASPVSELSRELDKIVFEYNSTHPEHCVVPYFLQIDNGYELPDVPAEDKKPIETNVPRQAYAASRGGILANARQVTALAFRAPFLPGRVLVDTGATGGPARVDTRYAHIYPEAHPGVQAPLGWSLSPSAVADLKQQLGLGPNVEAIDRVHDWLSGEHKCMLEQDPATID